MTNTFNNLAVYFKRNKKEEAAIRYIKKVVEVEQRMKPYES